METDEKFWEDFVRLCDEVSALKAQLALSQAMLEASNALVEELIRRLPEEQEEVV